MRAVIGYVSNMILPCSAPRAADPTNLTSSIRLRLFHRKLEKQSTTSLNLI
jgi:hypothetical protein